MVRKKLDSRIIELLQKNARIPFLEIARKLKVSGPTIHDKISKLEKSGVIKGYTAVIDEEKRGYDVMAFVGLVIKQDSDLEKLHTQLNEFDNVIEVNYLAGPIDVLIKIKAKNTRDLQEFLHNKIPKIEGFMKSETSLILRTP